MWRQSNVSKDHRESKCSSDHVLPVVNARHA